MSEKKCVSWESKWIKLGMNDMVIRNFDWGMYKIFIL